MMTVKKLLFIKIAEVVVAEAESPFLLNPFPPSVGEEEEEGITKKT